MLNRQALFFLFLLSFSSVYSFVPTGKLSKKGFKQNYTKNEKASLIRLCSSYIASLALSGAIGVATGSAVRYIEKRFEIESSPIGLLIAILAWTLESEFRNDIIAVLQQDLDFYKIKHKKSLMFKSAWIASWLAYLQM